MVEELIPEPPVIYIRLGFLHYPWDTSTISSPSDLSIPSIATLWIAGNVPLPKSSVLSPSLLSTELYSKWLAMPPQRPPSAARSIRSLHCPCLVLRPSALGVTADDNDDVCHRVNPKHH